MARRRIRIDLAYDGTDFEGWQLQTRGRTVQGTVEAALTRLAGDRPVRLRAASRTDSGVHARQQVADGLIDTRLDDAGLERALRALLPPDVRATRVATVPPGFHSMRDALLKTYRYRVDLSPHGDPLIARYALHHPFPFERGRVERGLAMLLGRRDWSGFADSRCRIRDRVRRLSRAEWCVEADDRGCFVFSADGFLTYMVRNLVGTLLEVARGTMEPDVIPRILRSGDRRLAAATAPARGLCLWEIVYATAGDTVDALPVRH
jgi:tRNA pseudouridine38-40 synthase